MSKFFVGQRVRVKWTVFCLEAEGRTATITSMYDAPIRQPAGNEDCTVRVDSLPGPENDGSWRAGTCQLEPAYDGNEVVSWSECLWQPAPEHVS